MLIRPINEAWDYWCPEGATDIVGLWDANCDPYVRWCNNGRTEYVWIFHDDADAELIATSEQGILAYLTDQYVELVDADGDELYALIGRFGEYIGFRSIEPYLEILRDYVDDQTFGRRFSQLMATL